MSIDPSFSFDVYPGLDAELDAAYRRNIEAGTASVEVVATEGLAAAIAENLDNSRGVSGENIPGNFRDKFLAAWFATNNLYSDTPNLVPQIDSEELKHIDWRRLVTSYDAMQDNALQPEIVISRNRQSLDDWKELYSKLPGVKGGGLFVYDEVAAVWPELSSASGFDWSVSIIATTPEPTLKDISHDLENTGAGYTGMLDDVFGSQLNIKGKGEIRESYPTLSAYLTLQAQRLQAHKEPVDSETASWLRGLFDNGTKAPYAYWDPDRGRVYVHWDDPGDQGDYLGVRPAVRGG